MDHSQLALTFKFVEFNFLDLYYKVKDQYDPELIEKWFEEGVWECMPRSLGPLPGGRALSIDRWTKQFEERTRKSSDDDQYVILQILQMMPLRLNGDDNARLVLHELVVVAWDCEDGWTPLKPQERRFKMKRREEEQFVLVLDRWVSHSVLHACRKGHLGLMFHEVMYLKMLNHSKELMKKVNEEVERGMNVQLGRSFEEISSNLDKYHKARALLRKVFDLVDVALSVVTGETPVEELQGVRMLITDELTGVKPSPMPSPVGQD